MRLSGEMRTHFEADPEDSNGEAGKGRDISYEMEDILNQVRRNA